MVGEVGSGGLLHEDDDRPVAELEAVEGVENRADLWASMNVTLAHVVPGSFIDDGSFRSSVVASCSFLGGAHVGGGLQDAPGCGGRGRLGAGSSISARR